MASGPTLLKGGRTGQGGKAVQVQLHLNSAVLREEAELCQMLAVGHHHKLPTSAVRKKCKPAETSLEHTENI